MSLVLPSLVNTSKEGLSTSLTGLESCLTQDQMTKLQQCGNMSYYCQCGACGTKVQKTFFCHLPLCPVCQEKRFQKFQNEFYPYLETFKRPRFITLTIKNKPTIGKQDFKSFSKNFHALKVALKRDGFHIEKGIRVFEVTEKGKGFHLHLHALYEGSYIPQSVLSDHWGRITKGSTITDIREVKSNEDALKYFSKSSLSRSPHHALSSITKYAYKKPDISIAGLADYLSAVKSVRMVQTFGTKFKRAIVKFRMICPVCGFDEWTFTFSGDNLAETKPDYLLETPPTQSDLAFRKIEHLLNVRFNAELVEQALTPKELSYLLNIGYIYSPVAGHYAAL